MQVTQMKLSQITIHPGICHAHEALFIMLDKLIHFVLEIARLPIKKNTLPILCIYNVGVPHLAPVAKAVYTCAATTSPRWVAGLS